MNFESEFALWRRLSEIVVQNRDPFAALEQLLLHLSHSQLFCPQALLASARQNLPSRFSVKPEWHKHREVLESLAQLAQEEQACQVWSAAHPQMAGLLGPDETLAALPLTFQSETFGVLLVTSPKASKDAWLHGARHLADYLSLSLAWAKLDSNHLSQEDGRLLHVILEQMAEGVLVAERSGKFKYFNPQAEALLGSRPSLKPEQWTRHYGTHSLDEDGVLQPTPYHRVPMYRALRGERVDNEELFLKRPDPRDGIWLSVNSRPLQSESGEALGAVSVCRDITNLKLAEQEARRAHQDFRRVIEASRDGIGIHREGRWVYVNSALLDILGYESSKDLCAIPLQELLSLRRRQDSQEWLHLSNRDEPPTISELRLKTSQGDWVLVEISPALLDEFEGGPAVLLSIRDLTERKRLESQLMVSDRMASLGTLAAGVGHEINNPLAVVTMNLEMTLQRLEELHPTEETSEMLEEALQAAKRVSHIVRDLKVLSSNDVDHCTPVNLHAILESTARVLNNEIRQRARLVKDFAKDVPLVMAVEPRLGQVVLNLLMNAVQAIPEGAVDSNTITISSHREEEFLSFTITDTGCGIEAEVGRQMFTPFFSTKRLGTGTGLGLPLCYRIVNGMGGSISFESTLGKGSSFTVRLPIALSEKKPRPASAPQNFASVGGRVLVVDDEPFICKCVQRILSQEHCVDICHDGSIALENIRQGRRYDVIVCDLMMPQMTGIQLFEVLQTEAPDQAQRMVFLTGGAFTTPARTFLARTPNPVLYKPCETTVLRNTVSRHLASLGKAQ